jgi:hypothetical protein
MIDEASEEALMKSRAAMYASLADQSNARLGGQVFRLNISGIEDEVKKAAKRKKDRLTADLNSLPLIRIPTGPGRQPGKSSKAPEELDRENEEHRKQILKAMLTLYRKESSINEFLAEDAITKKATAEELGVSRVTLDAWLASGNYEFEDLKEEALSSVK